MKAINCHSNEELVLRGRSKRDGELLLSCPKCGEKYQCREGDFSHPYQTKRKSGREIKSIVVSGRVTKNRLREILKNYDSVQDFLDNGG